MVWLGGWGGGDDVTENNRKGRVAVPVEKKNTNYQGALKVVIFVRFRILSEIFFFFFFFPNRCCVFGRGF